MADQKGKLVQESGGRDLSGERIAFLVENSYDYVGAQNILFKLLLERN